MRCFFMSRIYLEPLDQLKQLNAELHPILDQLTSPLIIVGGQSVSYWVDYYKDSINTIQTEGIASADIDFMMSNRSDIVLVAKSWELEAQFAGEGTQPPSVAIVALVEPDGKGIKTDKQGAQFVDFSKLNLSGEEHANIVDFIDAPAGFTTKELKAPKKRLLLTEQYLFPLDANGEEELQSHEKLLILNPLGCLKSRIANLLKTNKNKDLEIQRIKALCLPVYFFIQELSMERSPREVKHYYDELINLICSEEGVQVLIHHGFDLRNLLIDTLHLPNQPDKFYELELPNIIKKLNDKFDRRLAAHEKFLRVKAEKKAKALLVGKLS